MLVPKRFYKLFTTQQSSNISGLLLSSAYFFKNAEQKLRIVKLYHYLKQPNIVVL